jgi:hypothetical protein
VRLTLVGEVEPPSVDGMVVQANDVDISGHTAVVAFNFAGDVFAGAVQVIDFPQPDRPELVSEVLYRDADVDAVSMEGSHLYVGMGSDDPMLASPALLTELELTDKGLERTESWLDLPSYAVTDLAVYGNDLMASVGAEGGGIAYIERNKLQLVRFVPLADARGVVADNDAAMSVCGTTPAFLKHGLPGMDVRARVGVAGYRYPNAKGTLEVAGGRCYLGAGDGGFQVRSADGELLAMLTNGELSNVAPELMVTNAVSVDRNLAFVAAGALGVKVVDLGRWCTDGGSSDQGLRVLGQIGFEDGASSNMVKTKNNILVVASGLGGVKLVRMEFEED